MVSWPKTSRLALLALVAGCHRDPEPGTSLPEAAAALRGWHYTLVLAEDVTTAQVQVCFEGAPPRWFVAGHDDASHYAERARRLSDGHPLPKRNGSFSLQALGPGDCFAYDVSFFEMARAEGRSRRVRWVGDSVLLRSSMWLWRPDERPEHAEVTLTVQRPEGVEVSVPWPVHRGSARDADDPTFDLEPTAFRWLGYTAFGQLDVQRFQAAGTQIEIAALDGTLACDAACRRAWIVDAAQSSAMLYDGYPRAHLQALVLPVDGNGGGVYFGMAGRGGGAGVYLLLDSSASGGSLRGGWTTVHELLHHGMPYVDDAWMAEGWVSYYTEVMRTRMGHRSEEEGWQELYDAFERGRRTRRPTSLQRTSDNMHQTFAYQRVYWGGAAIAFFIDIALREDSNNEVSLDDAMKELRRCCGDAPHKWTAKQLLQRLDGWYGKPLFTEIAAQHLPRSGFPDVQRGFRSLGMQIEDGEVVLDPDHPHASLRASIMAPRRDR